MVQRAEYSVERTEGIIEVRNYPAMTLATVYGLPDDDAFGLLFDYIAGNNKSNLKIKMTTPVISSERIEMTAPVISNDRSFSFVLPARYDSRSAPSPLDDGVRIESFPARRVAVIRFRGRGRTADISMRESELKKFVERHGFKTKGGSFLMRYNPPFTPGFLRRNEVGIELA